MTNLFTLEFAGATGSTMHTIQTTKQTLKPSDVPKALKALTAKWCSPVLQVVFVNANGDLLDTNEFPTDTKINMMVRWFDDVDDEDLWDEDCAVTLRRVDTTCTI